MVLKLEWYGCGCETRFGERLRKTVNKTGARSGSLLETAKRQRVVVVSSIMTSSQ
jgi:hypothetical protein